ncbi:MAG TPA: hypothetical protein VJ476_06450 [Rhizomicrobium sp.]|nr:hypothetical protein [Rhizomicrobium sp.]
MAGKPRSREERLAAALRENLKRRKQAARAQGDKLPGSDAEPPQPRPQTAKKTD